MWRSIVLFVARSEMASDKAGRRVDRDRTDPSHELLDGLLVGAIFA
jgi:hypothetical protein